MAGTIALQGFPELSLGQPGKALTALEPLLPMVLQALQSTEIVIAGFVPDAAKALIMQGRFTEAHEVNERVGAGLWVGQARSELDRRQGGRNAPRG
jgi:hypothetical protein